MQEHFNTSYNLSPQQSHLIQISAHFNCFCEQEIHEGKPLLYVDMKSQVSV